MTGNFPVIVRHEKTDLPLSDEQCCRDVKQFVGWLLNVPATC